jgi:predicted aspartyl protease
VISCGLLALALAFLAGCATVPPGASRMRGEVPGYSVIPLVRGPQNHIFLRARINSRPATVLLDTGSPVTCVDESQKRRFKLEPFAGSDTVPSQVIANGEVRDVTMLSSLQLGILEITGVPAVLIDMRDVNQRFGVHRGDAILGSDILLARKAVVDYPGLRLFLRVSEAARGKLGPRLLARGWVACPMTMDQGHFVVTGSVDGRPLKFIVDTGAFGTALDRSFCTRNRLPLKTVRDLHSGGIGYSEKRTQITEVKLLRIGEFEIRNHVVGAIGLFELFGERPPTGTPVAALLGADILGKHKAAIDCEAMQLYLKP